MIPVVPLFVYQMGRVASTAIVRSLEARGVSVHHGHQLDPRWHRIQATNPGNDVEYALEAAHKAWLRHYLVEEKAAPLFCFISPFREPVAWLVSNFFQGYQRPVGQGDDGSEFDYRDFQRRIDLVWRRAVQAKDSSTEELYDRVTPGNFDDILLTLTPRLPIEWFDRELKRHTGIDVYQQPFAHGREYQMYGNVLTIKHEAFGAAAEGAIGRFAGLEDFELIRTNEGATGPFGGHYQVLLESCKFPAEFLDLQYGSKYVRHFYSDQEIESFYRKWQA